MNVVGALVSTKVAATVGAGIIAAPVGRGGLVVVFSALLGAITWNLLTWYFGLPSSSSHALIGGLVGAAIAASRSVQWSGVFDKVVVPMVLSPLVGFGLAYLAMVGVLWAFRKANPHRANRGFRHAQIGSAALMAFGHGTQDAQKTMGVITLALIGSGHWSHTDSIPFWVKLCCALAIASGTYIGGWRIIRTLGKGLVEITPPQGMAAESASAVVILASSQLGFALSTTHVATGSILGTGIGKRGAVVRWRVAGRMVAAWLITLPCSAIVGAVMWYLAHALGGAAGGIVIFLVLLAAAAGFYLRSRATPVHAGNVNDEWEGAAETAARTPANA
jgi:PiT family inorganic phosphate transporter